MPPTTSLSEMGPPASRAVRRDGVRASRARGLVDATAPARPTLADSMPSVPRVRTARFCDTRAAAPESARSAAASAIAASVPRAESSTDVRVRLTASSRRAAPSAPRRRRRAGRCVARACRARPSRSRPAVAGGIPDRADGADRARVAELRADLCHVDVDGAPAGRRGIPPHVAEQLLAGEDDPGRRNRWLNRSNSVAVRAMSRPATLTSWRVRSTVRSPARSTSGAASSPRVRRSTPPSRATSSRGEKGFVT